MASYATANPTWRVYVAAKTELLIKFCSKLSSGNGSVADLTRSGRVEAVTGVGKTVIASILITKLSKAITLDCGIGVAYIYHTYNRTDHRSISNMLGAVIQQLVPQSSAVQSELVRFWNNTQLTGSDFSSSTLNDLLCQIINMFKRVFLIVDALDEYGESTDDRETLVELLNSQPNQLAIMILSRPIPEIRPIMTDWIQFKVESHSKDMKAYLEDYLHGTGNIRRQVDKLPSLRPLIIDRITEKARGMFLLARLGIESLKDCITARDIKDALETLPSTLNETYHETLQRIRDQGRSRAELAMQTLSWIHQAYRPLTIDEIQHALAVKHGDTSLDVDGIPDVDIIVSVCSGLIVIQPESRVATLVHYTTEEFFRANKVFHSPDKTLALSCLTYLCIIGRQHASKRNSVASEESNLGGAALETDFPWLSYSALYWGDHARNAGPDEMIDEAALKFLSTRSQVNAVGRVRQGLKAHCGRHGLDEEFRHDTSGLCVAASFGLATVTRKLLSSGQNREGDGYCGQTPLQRAISNNFGEIAKILLDDGADIDAQDKYGWTALHWAASLGLDDAVRLLVRRNADVNLRDCFGVTPLFRAAECGHAKATEILIENGSSTSECNLQDQSALHRACEEGHDNVARILVTAGSDLLQKDRFGYNAWYRAKDMGHDSIAAFLKAEMQKQGKH